MASAGSAARDRRPVGGDGDGGISFSVHATDDLSGVDGVDVSASTQSHSLAGPSLVLTSGDRNDGTWTATMTVPRYTPAGHYDLWLAIRDRAGNLTTLTADQLAANGFPSAVDVADSST